MFSMALFFTSNHFTTMVANLLLIGFIMASFIRTGAQSIGVCNGRLGNNLPSEQETVNLYKRNGIGRMRIYDPNQATLEALKGSNIELILGVPNGDIESLAEKSSAMKWVQQNILAHSDVQFRYISVGNEVMPTDAASKFVLPAMQNIYDSIASSGLNIKVSTSVQASVMGASYPPSTGSFSPEAAPYIIPIVSFLARTEAPLLANIYPYHSYISDPTDINITYALFTSPGVVVQDGEFGYQNLFDATLDAFYSSLEKTGNSQVEVVVSETGWPSAGSDAATIDNAKTYYSNLIDHVNGGTPKRPGKPIEAYLFAMFDENMRVPAETERHFGLFSPDELPKYHIKFSNSSAFPPTGSSPSTSPTPSAVFPPGSSPSTIPTPPESSFDTPTTGSGPEFCPPGISPSTIPTPPQSSSGANSPPPLGSCSSAKPTSGSSSSSKITSLTTTIVLGLIIFISKGFLVFNEY